MKKYVCLILGVLSFILCGADYSKRFCRVANSAPVSLTVHGKSMYRITAAPYPVARFAAGELEKYLFQVTGTNPSPSGQVEILVGIFPPGVKAADLPRESFLIHSLSPGKIYIAGHDDTRCRVGRVWGNLYDRGTISGVYAFLERFARCRFVFAGELGEVVPRNGNLRIPAVELFDRPDNIDRRWNQWGRDCQLELLRLNYSSRLVPNCHGLARFRYAERFGKKHPEYFAMTSAGTRSNSPHERLGGHLCFSNPDLREEIYRDAKSYLSGESPDKRGVFNPVVRRFIWDPNAAQPGYFNVMPQDGFNGCRCPVCLEGLGKDPDFYGNQVWKMTVDFQKRLEREGVKGSLTQMAYGKLSAIPPFDIPGNVVVQVAIPGP